MVIIYLLNEEKGHWREYVKIYKSGRIRIYDEFWDKSQGCYIGNTAFGLTNKASLKLKEILKSHKEA